MLLMITDLVNYMFESQFVTSSRTDETPQTDFNEMDGSRRVFLVDKRYAKVL